MAGWYLRLLVVGLVVLGSVTALAQEYSISDPARQRSAPVHLTEPVSGRVEVVNQPPVQEVRVMGGALDQPLEVQGEVGLRLNAPLPVELVGDLPAPVLTLEAPVSITADEPLRVWVENVPAPVAPLPPVASNYAGFAFAGVFEAQQRVRRRTFTPPVDREFRLTDLTLDTRPDALLYVRVLAQPSIVVGAVVGAGEEELALLVLDRRSGPSARLATPIPLSGPFTVEVTVEGPGQGAPFAVLVGGTLR